jgi:hypothetical protein
MKTIRSKRSKGLLNRITRKNILGKGYWSTVYNAENTNGVHYALREGDRALPAKEIIFSETVATKYPNQLMKLYEYNNTISLWSKIDLTINDYIKYHNYAPSLKIMYDFYIQAFNIICIFQKEGWTHTDFHKHNIGVKKTNISTIIINNHKIPTHGYFIQAIDYGNIQHRVIDSIDIYRLFAECYDKINNKIVRFQDLNMKFTYGERKYLAKYIPVINKRNGITYFMILGLLYTIMYPSQFKQKYPNIVNLNFLPNKILLFIIKHINNARLCLNYLIENRPR